MSFFIRLNKELKNITTNSDPNKYRELKNMCINRRIQFESFTIDLKNISEVQIKNICEFLKLKNNNYFYYYFNNKNKDINYIDIDDYNVTEKFATEYFKFCLENPQINLGWKVYPLYKLNANMYSL